MQQHIYTQEVYKKATWTWKFPKKNDQAVKLRDELFHCNRRKRLELSHLTGLDMLYSVEDKVPNIGNDSFPLRVWNSYFFNNLQMVIHLLLGISLIFLTFWSVM